jgi:hypothetical protein
MENRLTFVVHDRSTRLVCNKKTLVRQRTVKLGGTNSHIGHSVTCLLQKHHPETHRIYRDMFVRKTEVNYETRNISYFFP